MDQALQLAFVFMAKFVIWLRPFLTPICFVLAWSIVVLVLWNLISAVRDGVGRAQKMHRVPCANCTFFTRDYHLKCPVHPLSALSEEAIGCADYEPSRSALQ